MAAKALRPYAANLTWTGRAFCRLRRSSLTLHIAPAAEVVESRCDYGLSFWRNEFLSAYGAVQRINERLNLDKFGPCSLRLVAIKRSSQHLHMRVPILHHTLPGFVQRFKSLAHFDSFAPPGHDLHRIGHYGRRNSPFPALNG